jgi:excisionase family DNA binding protein
MKQGRPREPRIVDPSTHPRPFVSLIVAAEYLGIDRRTLHKLIDEGQIEAVTRGCFLRVPVRQLATVRDLPLERLVRAS